MSRTQLGTIKGKQSIAATIDSNGKSRPYVIHKDNGQAYYYDDNNDEWKKLSNDGKVVNSLASRGNFLYGLTLGTSKAYLFDTSNNRGNKSWAMVFNEPKRLTHARTYHAIRYPRNSQSLLALVTDYDNVLKYHDFDNKWYHPFCAPVIAADVATCDNKFYFIDMIDRNVHECQTGETRTDWTSRPLPGDRKAIKVAVNEHFVCIIDRYNQICIHNGSYWEVLEEYGLAVDIALAGSEMYMISKFNNHIYKITP